MKKYLLKKCPAFRNRYLAAACIFLNILFSHAGAQVFVKPNNSYGTIVNRESPDSVFYFPTGCGVPTDSTFLHSVGVTGHGEILKKYAIYGDSCGGHAYLWNPKLKSWSLIGSGAGGGDSLLSQLQDMNISSTANLQILQYQTSDNKWHNVVSPFFRYSDTTALGFHSTLWNDLRYAPLGSGYIFTGFSSQYTDGTGAYHVFPTSNSSFTNGAGYLTSAFYQTLQLNTSSQTQRNKINFSTRFSLSDNSGNSSTDIDFANSVNLAGSPTTTTQTAHDSSTKVATDLYVDRAVASVVGGGGGSSALGSRLRDFIPTAVKNSAYTASASDFVPVDASVGNVPITLPNAPADSSVVGVKLISVGVGDTAKIIAQGSDVFNKSGGGTQITLIGANQGYMLRYNLGAHIWYVLADDLPLSMLDGRLQAKMTSDVSQMQEVKQYFFANGVASSNNVTNYTASSIDQNIYPFSSSKVGSTTSTDFGGWLTSNLSGDSVKVTAPFGVVIGHSVPEGHPNLHGRLHPNGVPGFVYNYPDSSGQLSYQFDSLTHFKWYNQGIGGENSSATRKRFFRDGLGDSLNINDTRPNRTLSRQPAIIYLDCIVNDFTGGISTQQTQDNLAYIAAVCQQRGVKLVLANCEGDNIFTQVQLTQVANINKWLADGALDQYGVTVVDINSWWNDPAYGGDNYHGNSMLADDIHPTKIGYRSLANYIFAAAHLPVLTKMVILDTLSNPTPFTGYSRPSAFTVNGTAYTSSFQNDTIALNSYVPDSVWIKITGSTNVSGTSYTGFSTIKWFFDNNASNLTYYTKKTLTRPAPPSRALLSFLNITTPSLSPTLIANMNAADGTNFFSVSSGTSDQWIWGSAALNNPTNSPAKYSFTGDVTANGAIRSIATTGSLFGSLQLGYSSGAASTTGLGVGITGDALLFQSYRIGYTFGGNAFIFNSYLSPSNINFGNSSHAYMITEAHSSSSWLGHDDTVTHFNAGHTINNPVTNQQNNVDEGFLYNPTITSQGSTKLIAFRNMVGDNYFNEFSGRTVYGSSGPSAFSANVEMGDQHTGFMPPRISSSQRDSIGYVKGITISGGSWTIAPTITISAPGGTGTTATVVAFIISGTTLTAAVLNHGTFYKPGSSPTATITGGTGSGSTATLTMSGPDSGLVIFNTTVDSLQYYNGSLWVDVGGNAAPSSATYFSDTTATNLTVLVANGLQQDIIYEPTTSGTITLPSPSSATNGMTIRISNQATTSGTGAAVSMANNLYSNNTSFVTTIASGHWVQLHCDLPKNKWFIIANN